MTGDGSHGGYGDGSGDGRQLSAAAVALGDWRDDNNRWPGPWSSLPATAPLLAAWLKAWRGVLPLHHPRLKTLPESALRNRLSQEPPFPADPRFLPLSAGFTVAAPSSPG